MSQAVASPALQQLVVMIREATGNVVPSARLGFLEEVAQRRAHARGLAGVAAYVEALAARQIEGEWTHLVPLVTIKESYFFRAPQQFEAIRERVLPELVRSRAGARHLRIWSAACARGEEPASLAMLLAEEPSLAGWEWSIVATDLDEEALAGARLGLYGARAVAQVPPHLLERWFSRRGKLFELAAELRSRIVYQPINLAHAPFSLPLDQFDLILLRNVLIYFRRPLQRWVVSQVAPLLAPSGLLFLGASETLWQIQDELEAVDLGPCFGYRHRRSAPVVEKAAPKRVVRPRLEVQEEKKDFRDRRDSRAPTMPAVPAESAMIVAAGGVYDRLTTAVRELLENRVDDAALTVGQALAADPSEPAAHALEGFVHDLRGRTEDAVASYRAALYLDPALFQVRALLADGLLRLGDRSRAEHQFREVLSLLGSGRERGLTIFESLPLPDRERARRRSRQVLKG
ncbi:MAG TPA: CheR family methyltransferase [Thermoanaerobaculia bacterium]|jgi:chemotaxis protein methyltransferase CheR|nr:CheR family methyltransferase [Thermoanaerobaculia bacterium]